ncbi:F-box domain-containing protein [Forsythia ovata]|uniref:F-box domain-containing protein n=1 Tax=Forsythia ovata TaxID=205694 RepID=A0ABD1TSE9_9LAMI
MIRIQKLGTRYEEVVEWGYYSLNNLVCLHKLESLKCLFLVPSLAKISPAFKLHGCREISDQGTYALAQNCKSLRKFSCGSCLFGAKCMNALLNNCSSLGELFVKHLRDINDGFVAEPIGPGAAASLLKSITLKELYSGQNIAHDTLISRHQFTELDCKNLLRKEFVRPLNEFELA